MKKYKVEIDDKKQNKLRKEIDLESLLLLTLDHPNIIKMYEFRDVGL